MPDDAHLVGLAREGDATAFEQLVRRYFRAAYAVALSGTGDADDAEDVCQDAFVVALERLDECRRPERFAAWLLQIVRHRAHNFRRHRSVRSAAPLVDVDNTPGPDNPLLDAERAQLRERLVAGLDAISETQREVVLLHDLEGWKHREIAQALGFPEGTVRYHLHQARRALRSLLGASLRGDE
ncbi:MAG: sigma-70 family RNA polymerase sigma factor [Gemmatimonadetes bacterium]|nr:sigma-70 family RNA polymerase sigma factor [Gemmatimonadota bacterium]